MMKLEKKMMLWSTPKTAPDGPDQNFQPYLEPYLLPGDTVRGCVLVLPGGGYGARAPHVFVLVYTVNLLDTPLKMQSLQDISRAVRMIRSKADRYSVDPDRVAVCGFSAGGHLACSTGIVYNEVKADNGDECDAASARPDAEILCYPVITGVPGKGHMGSFENLLGKEVPREEYLTYSWERRVRPDTPPAFLWHTAEDTGVPVENSLEYALALRQQKIPFAVHIFPNGPHGVGLADNRPGLEDVTVWPELAGTWLKKMEF